MAERFLPLLGEIRRPELGDKADEVGFGVAED